MFGDELRAGRHAMDHQRADQHRGDRPGRNAERQHRHEGAGRGGIVGRFRAGDAGDRALAEFFRMLGDAPLQRIGQEAGNDVRGAGDDADDEAEHAAARDRPVAESRHSLPGRQQFAQFRRDHLADHLVARRRQDFAEAEQADRDRHDADAVAELVEVEAVAEMAGHVVDADHAEHQAEAGHQQRAHQRGRRHVGEEDQAHAPAARCIPAARTAARWWRAAARSPSAR